GEVRYCLEECRPVLGDLCTTTEAAPWVHRLRAGEVLGEQGCHALGIMGVDGFRQPLQRRWHAPGPPKISCRWRESGWVSETAGRPCRYVLDRWLWHSC